MGQIHQTRGQRVGGFSQLLARVACYCTHIFRQIRRLTRRPR